MDINDIFVDRSLNNLEWMNEETFIPNDKDINKKDDLSIEWDHGGMVIEDGPPPTTIRDEMPLTDTQQSVPTLLNDAYLLLHQGVMGKSLVTQLRVKYLPEILDAALPQLKKLIQNEGIVGCVAIDLQKYNDFKDVIIASNKSPYKRHIKYALMTEEQLENSYYVEKRVSVNTNMEEGTIDGFFSASESDNNYEYIFKPLDLKVIVTARREDLDEEYYDKTLVELAALGDISQEEAEKIKNSKVSKIQKLRCAFRLAHRSKMNKKITKVVADDSEDFKIKSNFVFSIDNEVDHSNIDFSQEVASMTVDVSGVKTSQDIEFKQSDQVDFNLDEVKEGKMLDVNGTGSFDF